MTVLATDSSKTFTGSGTPGPFSWSWRFLSASHILAYRISGLSETLLVAGVDYSLTGAGSYQGGSLTLTVPLLVGESLRVERNTLAIQDTDLRNQGDFFAETHEDVFDRLTMILQERERRLSGVEGVIAGFLGYIDTALLNPADFSDYTKTLHLLRIISKGPIADAEAFGAVGDGIQENDGQFNTALAQADRAVSVGIGAFLVDNTVDIPAYKDFVGLGINTKIKAKDTPGVTTLFRCNTDGAGGWPVPFPGELSSKIGNIYFSVVNAVAAELTAFEFGGSQHFSNIHAGGVQTLIKQINQYSDLVRIERVGVFNQPSTASYIIDLQYAGDGVVIDQVLMFRQYDDGLNGAGDPASGRRVRGIRLRYKRGARITNVLNGDIYLDRCEAVHLSSLHMEDGLVTFAGTSGTLQNAAFWMRGDGRGEISVTPLVATSGGLNPCVLDWSDISFIYQQSFPGGYSTTKPNFTLTAPFCGTVKVRNLRREVVYNSGLTNLESQKFGVTCGSSDFDNYSHIASSLSEYRQDRWIINANLGDVPNTDGVIDTVNSGTSTDRVWQGATGTYYYKAQILLDKMRLLGLTGTAEKAIATVNGGDCPVIVLNASCRPSSVVRLYRGTASGVYDYYVDVPLLSGSRLADSGADVAGFPWIARAPGAVSAVNGNLVLGLELRPGETSAASDAYGQAVVRTRGNAAIPTVGAWRRGDMVIPSSVYNDNCKILVGYRRLTDCTLAAPAHVLNTDWVELWAEYRAAAYSSAELSAIGGTVNTVHKQVGKAVYCSTLNKPLWSKGNNPGDDWVDATGATVITPA